MFSLLAAKERTRENCRCFDAADPRPGATRPLEPQLCGSRTGGSKKSSRHIFLTPRPPAPVLRLRRKIHHPVGAGHAPPATQWQRKPNGQTARDAYMRPLQTCRKLLTSRLFVGRVTPCRFAATANLTGKPSERLPPLGEGFCTLNAKQQPFNFCAICTKIVGRFCAPVTEYPAK